MARSGASMLAFSFSDFNLCETLRPPAVIFFTAKCAEKYPLSCEEIFCLSFTMGISHTRDGLFRLTFGDAFETASFFMPVEMLYCFEADALHSCAG
jgi:hypothetical protein